ncbi:MAG: hypothetical protein QOF69_322 [Solirubrobacteraceae bacterium]|jgi:hypothetical protein|nr:hypothetical protein [Solirubrobacteraceae bacterium]
MDVRSLSIAAAATIAALAAPGAAQAATTYTVAAGNGTCGGTDHTCESLSAAAGVVAAGDTVTVSPGTYAESATFAVPSVTITGSTAGTGVLVTGSITFSGNGADPSVLEKVVVAPSTEGSPAVGVTGTAGVAVRDALLVSTGGTGMTIGNGDKNSLTRSTVVSGGGAGTAVLVQPGSAATNLTLDSTILSGGPSGSGLTVNTGAGSGLLAGTGDATITARHITVAGSANGIVLDSSKASGVGGVGNIAATVTDSIVLGASSTKNYAGLPLPLLPANQATLAFTRTDQTTAAETLFANPAKRNFHIRADAPAIDKAQITPGDSPTDIDGQSRSSGASSDQGADEFVNTAPKAVLAVKTPAPRSQSPVLFDASGSTDREAGLGGEIVKYRWSFGDGQTAETTTAQTSHTYAAEGAIVVTLSVVDKQGASSEPVSVPLSLGDGTPPAVTITVPVDNQKAKRSKRTTKTVTKNGKKTKVKTTKLTPITIGGTATDKSGVKSVVITIEKLGSASTGTKAQCTWLDPTKGLVKRACAKPVLIRPHVSRGIWAYKPLKKLKKGLSAGTYRVSAYGTDNSGAFGNSAPKNKVIRFTLTNK